MALIVNAGAPGARRLRAPRAALPGLLALVLAGLSVFVLAAAPWNQLAAHLASRGWPRAEATVTSVALREVPGPAGGHRLALVVAYAFEADGAVHEGRRASLDDEAGFDDRLKALYTRLNFSRVTGRPVPVFHDPDEPGLALVDRDLAWWPVLGRFAAATALMGAALACAAVARRRAASA